MWPHEYTSPSAVSATEWKVPHEMEVSFSASRPLTEVKCDSPLAGDRRERLPQPEVRDGRTRRHPERRAAA